MSHFAKYFAIALASMAVMKAGLINIPLPHGFPEVNFMFMKEISITETDLQKAHRPDNLNPISPIFMEIPLRLAQMKKGERYLFTGGNLVWGRVLLEFSDAEDAMVDQQRTEHFHYKLATGLSINPHFFVKLNVAFQDIRRFLRPINSSYCLYPSIFMKTAWFNVDIGFGSDEKIEIRPKHSLVELTKYPYILETGKLIANSLLKNASYDGFYDQLLSFPIRVSFSVNFLAFGS